MWVLSTDKDGCREGRTAVEVRPPLCPFILSEADLWSICAISSSHCHFMLLQYALVHCTYPVSAINFNKIGVSWFSKTLSIVLCVVCEIRGGKDKLSHSTHLFPLSTEWSRLQVAKEDGKFTIKGNIFSPSPATSLVFGDSCFMFFTLHIPFSAAYYYTKNLKNDGQALGAPYN